MHPLPSWVKQTQLGEISLIYCQSNQSRIMRNKNKSKKHLPPTPPFFPGSTSLWIFSTSTPELCRGTGSGGHGQFTHCLCRSFLLRGRTPHTPTLLQQGVPPTGNSPPQTPPMWVLSTGCSPPRTAPEWVPCGVQLFRNRLLQSGCPTGSQALSANLLRCGLLSPWGHRSWQEPAPVQGLHGVTASFGHPPALTWGPFHGLQVEICSAVDLHGLQGDNLHHQWSSPWTAGERLLQHLKHLLPLLLQ